MIKIIVVLLVWKLTSSSGPCPELQAYISRWLFRIGICLHIYLERPPRLFLNKWQYHPSRSVSQVKNLHFPPHAAPPHTRTQTFSFSAIVLDMEFPRISSPSLWQPNTTISSLNLPTIARWALPTICPSSFHHLMGYSWQLDSAC